jgi:hypothetical protein
MPKFTNYNQNDAADQFRAEMQMQEDPWVICCRYEDKRDMLFICQADDMIALVTTYLTHLRPFESKARTTL